MPSWWDEEWCENVKRMMASLPEGQAISTRLLRCLLNEGCYSIGDAAKRTRKEWSKVPNLGAISLAHLERLLHLKGLYFLNDGKTPQLAQRLERWTSIKGGERLLRERLLLDNWEIVRADLLDAIGVVKSVDDINAVMTMVGDHCFPEYTAGLGPVKSAEEHIRFLITAMAGEAGEALNIIKKEWRGDGELDRAGLMKEVADTLNYGLMLGAYLGYDLFAVMRAKLEEFERKLAERQRKA